jgi:hypothetical protein
VDRERREAVTELFRDRVTAKADVWALGCVLLQVVHNMSGATFRVHP